MRILNWLNENKISNTQLEFLFTRFVIGDTKALILEVLNNYQREKLDESNDEEFYSDPKFVYHLDANFRQNLSDLYEREIDNYSTVLDFCLLYTSPSPRDGW